MAVKVPVSDAEREQIRILHARGGSAGSIARQLGRSQSTITRQCKVMGLSFDRSATEQAVRAHQLDAKARRAALAEAYLGDAERLRVQLWEECEDMAAVGGMEPTVLRWRRSEPSFPDKERIIRASGLAADKHMKLAQFDAEGGVDHARSMLGQLVAGLAAAVSDDLETPQDDS